ncbi:hypothetical protein JAAARDRAFT_346485 [Jaapia argillacea MUCL 33604]|uniref:Uncharacterized protein n=1 Tax=Jaapia argillacea MUCL 33604 TaxID=933084 RepID=A0A067PK39_9AGAM|nr:hypothetical protein JAAARDRAFT_346485 [Jaapia argillacea MUCL 33604]
MARVLGGESRSWLCLSHSSSHPDSALRFAISHHDQHLKSQVTSKTMFKSKGKKKGVADAVLDNSGFALTFLANLADGAIAVPGLKAAAQIAKQLIEVAQKVKSNKEDCMTVATRTCDLVVTLVKCLEGKREEEIEEGLRGNIDEFGRYVSCQSNDGPLSTL